MCYVLKYRNGTWWVGCVSLNHRHVLIYIYRYISTIPFKKAMDGSTNVVDVVVVVVAVVVVVVVVLVLVLVLVLVFVIVLVLAVVGGCWLLFVGCCFVACWLLLVLLPF